MVNLLKIILLLALLVMPVTTAWADGKYASIVVDAGSGKVLESTNAQAERHPASLTKMMTLYLTFKALRQGTLRINQALPVSEYAAAQAPSKLGLTPGSVIRVRDAILGLVTQSANDAAVVLAEALGGSEGNFARKMTDQARALGMKQTVYRNASGLPDDDQITTARDMAILGRALFFNFPDYYRFFSTTSFSYRGRTYANHNHLMNRYHGMDGIKTGYIRASGFNLVASAVRGKTRLIAVIFGGNTARDRDRAMAALLDGTFTKIAKTGGAAVAAPLVAQAKPDNRPAEGDAKDEEAEDAAEPANAAAAKPQTIAAAQPGAATPVAPAAATAVTPEPVAATTTSATAPAAAVPQPTTPAAVIKLASASKSAIAPGTMDGIKLPTVTPPTAGKTKTMDRTPSSATTAKGDWSVQIGSYALRNSAEAMLKKAAKRLPKNLGPLKSTVTPLKEKQKTVYGAFWTGLDKTTAKKICQQLGAKYHCRTIEP